ncbi:hypothetical protein E8E12_001904 [Didymella heteroderae]|uniref:Uncharacterized protein n=1 Tax=Didymella heteroderae TaxID=1769908 RepID=A0A9P4WGE2_9PLEO|nr:hypothetical protein E8E12_001904 [Didymella heteroderae]
MDHVCAKLSRNSGIKALFGGPAKKPLTTSVSMRHFDEIVRERNQYSRDAQEAWQGFINLKGRMDRELSRVSERNDFLVEELDSWKQQFVKFQTFAEQLTGEILELKGKIENHKREHCRLTELINQQKENAARLTTRLSRTEKQRDDTLKALVLQHETSQELERELERNKKELTALQHDNSAIVRQRDETQRVVVHLRALIEGQIHRMEHVVKPLNEDGSNNHKVDESAENVEKEEFHNLGTHRTPAKHRSEIGTSRGVGMDSQVGVRPSTANKAHLEGEKVTVDLEDRLHNSPARNSKRCSNQSMVDVTDRMLRDKTDTITYIIRNISEQCAAAVEGLQRAQRAETEGCGSGIERRTSLR